MIPRDEYLNFLLRFKNQQLIKVISGIRRCGKSTLLELFREYLLNNGVDKEQIIFINFEDLEYEELQDYHKLYNYVKSKMIPDKMNYVFLDEIQHVKNFEKAVDSLFIKKTPIFISPAQTPILCPANLQPCSREDMLNSKCCLSRSPNSVPVHPILYLFQKNIDCILKTAHFHMF